MTRHSYAHFSLLALSIAAAVSSPAQAASEPKTDSTMVVSAQGDGSDNSVAPYTNSATKSAVPESRTAQTIDTIGKQEIEKRHATSLNEVLRYDAGVSSEMRGSTTYMSEYKIRGFSAEHEYYNGLQLPYNVSGNTKASIDPILIEQVDILKGPSSVLYGNASPGGLVNIQGKTPQKQQSTEVGFNSGNRNLREGYLDSTGQIADSDWNYRFIGKASAGDDQPETTKTESYLLAPSVTWQPSEQTRLTLDAIYQNQPSLTPSNPLPLAYLRSGYASRRDYAGDSWNGFQQRQTLLGYSFEHQFDSGWGVVQKARYATVETYQRSIYSTGTSGSNTELSRFGYTTDEDLDSFNIDNQLKKTVELGDWTHHLLAGFDYQHLNSNFKYDYGTAYPGIDMLNPDHNQLTDDNLGLYTATKQRLSFNQAGYYLQDQLVSGGLNLVASLRYDDYRSTTTNQLDGDSKSWVDQHRVTKRLGALYQFSNGIAPYISYSEGFMPVSPQGTLTADQAKPTTSEQVEGGVKYLLANYATTLTASVFKITQKNVLTTDYTYDANSQLNYRQTGEVESKGVEFTAVSRPLDNLNLLASYAYTHAINTEDDLYQGQRATQVPENALKLWADYTFDDGMLNGLMLGAGLRYQGKTAITPDNSEPAMGGNTQYDLAVAYDMGVLSPSLKGLTLKAGAQNVTNKFTYTCYSSSYCWIGRDRTWQAGVSYRF
ncbi:TonB-dependent siderophore receptor [Erwiniaceae bacterium BAC15a-03b]|uniref:TonB-dependent siderophore receptor n=1 Tax=Winslowiella arboricola TaxID=2978220 RepID=A0A9J6PRB0_9GAMM|nr:TonB-dependent siderophore receptor [Winslowiella arboricola]MCU5774352.1 TonB-dependent siderophore receptor [Winslowiella arboricola]MCU5778899.1 TonB-dependent siderophore receptor [Winslowiella arboricola]